MHADSRSPSQASPILPMLVAISTCSCATDSSLAQRRVEVTLEFFSQPCLDCGSGIRGNPYGYKFTIDGAGHYSIAADGTGGVSGSFLDGAHEVALLGVVAPCTSDSPHTVTFEPHVVTTKVARFLAYCPPA